MEPKEGKLPLPDDPILVEARSKIDPIPGIRIIHFLGRLDDTTFFVQYMLKAFGHVGRLQMKDSLRSGLPKLLEMIPLGGDLSEGDRTSAIADMTQKWNKALNEKTDKCEKWVVNQGLIGLCTVFDGFLEDVVDVLLRQKPLEFLPRLKAKATYKQIAGLDEQGVLDHFRSEEVRAFAFDKIDDRFRRLEKTFKLKESEVFDFSGFYPDRRKVVDGSSVETITGIYKDRQGVVHRDALVLKDYASLNRVYELLSSLVINIARLAARVHKTPNEASKGIAIGELYSRLKAKRSGS